MDAAVRVLDAAMSQVGAELEYVEIDAGADTFRRTGVACSAVDVERLRHEVAATLKGPVGLPDVRLPDGTEAGVLGGILRTGLDAYANIRPILLLPGVTSCLNGRKAGDIDYVIVRENTEGLYASRGKGVGNEWAVADTLLATREGTLRIARKAFEIAAGRDGAPGDGVRRVTCVDKSNVLRSHALFRDIVAEVAEDWPGIEVEYLYADAAAQALVLRPEHFDVLVLENFLGDVLSDLGGATVGGISLCPSGNIGAGAAYFEPIHGSAPGLAGRGVANPVGQLLAAAMLLDHLGESAAARAVRSAVSGVLGDGSARIEPDGSVRGGAQAVADAVVSAVVSAVVGAPRPEC